MQILPPQPADFGFYAGYISKAPDTDLITALEQTMSDLRELAATLSPEDLELRYAPGKWSIQETYQHLVDAERNFCYRIMRISRGDTGTIAPFDIYPFVVNSAASQRSFGSILEELEHLRRGTILMFQGMTPEMIDREGPARDIVISVRALGFAMTGHCLHHIALIREKYLNQPAAAAV